MNLENDAVNDPEVLESLYWREGLSMWEIAKRLGCGETTVRRRMAEYGIDRRGVGHNTRAGASHRAPEDVEVHFRTRKDGYEVIGHTYRGENSLVYVHQIVAIAGGADPHKVFSGDYDSHHKNGIKYDNRPENIELMTREEHMRHHAIERGLGDGKSYTDEEMLSWLDSFVQELGVVPEEDDLRGWPGPSAKTYRFRFGTFTKAVRAAGYTPRSEQ